MNCQPRVWLIAARQTPFGFGEVIASIEVSRLPEGLIAELEGFAKGCGLAVAYTKDESALGRWLGEVPHSQTPEGLLWPCFSTSCQSGARTVVKQE